jgi:hypothetical protein
VAELLEGATYQVRDVTFRKGRPMTLTDPRVIDRVRGNARFRVRDA